MEERQKTNQNVFLPWKKDTKQARMYFCHGRKTENLILREFGLRICLSLR